MSNPIRYFPLSLLLVRSITTNPYGFSQEFRNLCFYLAQNYFKLSRQTIRENANFVCLFRQDLKNVNHVYNDHVSSDMSKEEFRNLCKRENANFVCLFRQDLKNVNHVYNDHVSSDMTKEEFRNVCKLAWEKPYGFVVVDLTSNKDNGKYRIGLDTFYIPN